MIASNDLGNTFQLAYKAGHSTETALLCIQNEIHLSVSKSMPRALVLLDLSAAFDTMDYDTLISCVLTRFGFSGTVLKWFTTYLLDHSQSVKIGSVISECFKLNFGVPRGSVFGPYTPTPLVRKLKNIWMSNTNFMLTIPSCSSINHLEIVQNHFIISMPV